MPSFTQRLKLLRGEPPAAVASLIARALPVAEPPERERLFRAAVASGRPAALAAAISVLHELRSGALGELIAADVSLDRAVGVACRHGGGQTRVNALAVAQRRAATRALPHVVACLDDVEDEVARAAARALLTIVTEHIGPHGRGMPASSDTQRIDDAIVTALDAGRRDLDEVPIAAAIASARPGPRLAARLADPESPAAFRVRRAPARTDLRLVRCNLLRWLGNEYLGRGSARRLADVRGAEGIAELLSGGHLVLLPAQRRSLGRVDRVGLPDHEVVAALPEEVQPALVRLIGALPASASRRRAALADCVAAAGPTGRLLAVTELLGDRNDKSHRILDDACDDPHEPVAFLAARHALRRHTGVPPQLEDSPHRVIARRAREAAAAGGPRDLVERWAMLPPAARVVAARTVLAAGPRELRRALQQLAGSGTTPERLAVIAIAQHLGLAVELEEELVAAAADGDARLASAAVAALASCPPSVKGLGTVRRALGHRDPRVRANAVETLMRLDPASCDHLRDLVAGCDNRLRANAVRALLRRSRRAADVLRAMLRDPDPRHRVSAVWVARRERVADVAADLRRLGARDRLPEVRARAAAALEWVSS